jgi:hypothetical protein
MIISCPCPPQDFPNTKHRIPVDYLFDLFGRLQPRAFSIASSPKVIDLRQPIFSSYQPPTPQAHPGELHFSIAVINYKTRMAVPRTGTFTAWLQTLTPNSGGALLFDTVFSPDFSSNCSSPSAVGAAWQLQSARPRYTAHCNRTR